MKTLVDERVEKLVLTLNDQLPDGVELSIKAGLGGRKSIFIKFGDQLPCLLFGFGWDNDTLVKALSGFGIALNIQPKEEEPE